MNQPTKKDKPYNTEKAQRMLSIWCAQDTLTKEERKKQLEKYADKNRHWIKELYEQ